MADQLEDFAEFEAKVQSVLDILEGKDANNEPEPETQDSTEKNFDHIDVDNCRLKVRENRTLINKRADDSQSNSNTQPVMDQATFMKQVEQDSNERAQERATRERQATQQRSQGNEAFRKQNYEKAILHYDKSLQQIKNSAITYNNRALCYIKLNNYKRALEDCNYVLDKLSETNLRAWLYRATAYKRLKDEQNFGRSLDKAREHNPDHLEYIDNFVKQMDEKI